jgi:hypothetical protein
MVVPDASPAAMTNGKFIAVIASNAKQSQSTMFRRELLKQLSLG